MKKLKPRILMCAPTFFDVPFAHRLNVWMDLEKKPDGKLAMRQWENLAETYVTLGADVSWLNAQSNFFDQVFTANDAWGMNGVYVMANFGVPWRVGEEIIAAEWLVKNRMSVIFLPDYFSFEGQGDIITVGDKAILYCYGKRNSLEVCGMLQEIFALQGNKIPFVPIELVDERFYHGDTCIRYSGYRDALLYIPEALGVESRKFIENLPVKKKKASPKLWWQKTKNGINFPMNGCYVGKTEIFAWDERESKFPKSIRDWIEEDGGEVLLLNFDQFGLSGAGPRCVSLFIDPTL